MKMLKFMLVMMTFVFLTGCGSTPNSNYKKITDLQKNEVISASYIQWNSEYAVTAKHNLYPKNPDYVSDTLDLAFFKNKADSHFNENIQWRNPSIDEPVVHVGSSRNDITLNRNGLALNQLVSYEGADLPISTANVMKGMSGGPVYSQDKKYILGMTVARTSSVEIAGKKYASVALFIESSRIEEEWNKFQKQ